MLNLGRRREEEWGFYHKGKWRRVPRRFLSFKEKNEDVAKKEEEKKERG